jgi:hypothetical protein
MSGTRRIVIAQISQHVSVRRERVSDVNQKHAYQALINVKSLNQITKISYAQNGIFLSKYRIQYIVKSKNLRKETIN